jgi:outer membrane murein-binding lipoprotein Lpp
MTRLTLFAVAVVVIALAGGAVFLSTWDIPPPSAKIEKVLPDARFAR